MGCLCLASPKPPSAVRDARRTSGLRVAAVRPDWDLLALNGSLLHTPGHQRSQPAGSIAGVSCRAELRPSAREVLSHLVDRNGSLVSLSRLTGGRSVEDFEAAGENDAAWSMDSAIGAAASFLGRPVQEIGFGAVVESVREGTAALLCADIITAVDGEGIGTALALQAALFGRWSARLTVERPVSGDRETRTITVPVSCHPDGTWGIRVVTAGRVVEHSLIAGFNLPDDLRGPSLGLACALSVIDAFTGGQLGADGDVVATGTVDLAGRVGGVGAMVFKARAVRAHSQIRRFLVPADPMSDVDDARRIVAGRAEVVAVSTLAEAVQVLGGLS
jgi:PDZ domain-containing secreted protein